MTKEAGLNPQTKEIIELLTDWKNEVRSIQKDYDRAINKLESARMSIESQRKNWWSRNKSFIMVVLYIIAIILSIVSTLFGINKIEINLKEWSFSASSCTSEAPESLN